MQILKDNWVWIAAPVLLFALLILAVVLMSPEALDSNGYDLK